MKKLAIVFLGMVILATGCRKNNPQPASLSSIKYTPETKTVEKGKVMEGPVATKLPNGVTVKFAIKSIKKGTADFTNPSNGIKIDVNTGKLSLAKGNALDKDTYKVTVEGIDQKKKTVKKTTMFTIIIN